MAATTITPSWTEELKTKLAKLAASESAFELYPGTPAYIARASLLEAISATWRDALFDYVRADVKAGVTGRRRHYWHAMECLVVYELTPDATQERQSLHPNPDARVSVAEREAFLSRATQHATYIPCPQFLGAGMINAPPSPGGRSIGLPSPPASRSPSPASTIRRRPPPSQSSSESDVAVLPAVASSNDATHVTPPRRNAVWFFGLAGYMRRALFGLRAFIGQTLRLKTVALSVASVGLFAFGLMPRWGTVNRV